MTTNVPNSVPSKGNVPNSRPTKTNVPNTKPVLASKTAKQEVLVPDKVTTLDRNRRPYVGQRLGVRNVDGTVDEIKPELKDLALLLLGSPRVKDRAPWSGLPIVEM